MAATAVATRCRSGARCGRHIGGCLERMKARARAVPGKISGFFMRIVTFLGGLAPCLVFKKWQTDRRVRAKAREEQKESERDD